jgi:L-erythro-3,5-diaminohexanoate dehydrogenase
MEPAGALPQAAQRLDASGPVRPWEIEVAVERLCLDSTSMRQMRERTGDDPDGVAARILEIAGERGKMHNPVTKSGGVLVGRVSAVGDRYPDPPAIGAPIVTLASLTLTPLRLEHVGPVGKTTQVPVRGVAYVAGRASWAPLPDDLPLRVALDVFEVCSAAHHARELVHEGDTVTVLGAGHAGRVAAAAARVAAGPRGRVAVVDNDPWSLTEVERRGLCDVAVQADLRDAVGAVEALRAAGVGEADVTIVVVNATGCEAAAILMTAQTGAVLFFSMATSFGTAALTADGLGSTAEMLVGNGHSPDRGAYALELVRANPALLAAMTPAGEEAAA